MTETLLQGAALLKEKMTRNRWISGVLTDWSPDSVNIHGQYANRRHER